MIRLFVSAIAAMLLAAGTAFASSHQVNGEVVKIDKAAHKITMKHGPIKSLDMDAMTMVFRAGDPAMLKGLKAGDKIKFDADRVNGQITVTKLQKAK